MSTPALAILSLIAFIGVIGLGFLFVCCLSAARHEIRTDSSEEITDQILQGEAGVPSRSDLNCLKVGRVGFAETGSTRFAHGARSGLRRPGNDPARVSNSPVHRTANSPGGPQDHG